MDGVIWIYMSSERSRNESDAGDVALDQLPTREPQLARRRVIVTEWPEWVLFSFLAAIFLVFGTAISMDKSSELPRALASVPLVIGELHPNISEVNEVAPEDGALEITLVQVSPMYPASVVTDFAGDALVVLQRMQKFFPKVGNRVVRFVAKAPPHPTDGELSGLVHLLSIEFERSEVLAKVKDPEFTLQDLLNEASNIRYLDDISGPRYVGAFCRDAASRSASSFCKRQSEGEDR